MQKIRALLISAIVLVLATLFLLVVKVVPDGRQAVLERGPAREAVGPGLHLRGPGYRVTLYPSGPLAVRFPAPADTAGGVYRLFSAEGAEIRLAVELDCVLDPDGLVAFHDVARGLPDAPIRERLKTELRNLAAEQSAEALTSASSADLAGRLTAALAPRLSAIGVRLNGVTAGSVTLAPGAAVSLARAHADSRSRRVLVIGIDSADWTIVNRLRAAGRLPVLDRVIRGGASGPLRSIEPLLSPLIWTTIATGVGPERHGILDFLTPDPVSGKPVPATSRLRSAPALWNLAPAFGKRAGVVGWLATWPAEPIEGFVVTDRFGFLAFAGQVAGDPSAADLTQPPDLLSGREDRAVRSTTVSNAAVRRFISAPEAEVESVRRPGYEKGNRINNFIHTLATADSYARIGLDLYRDERPDLMMVYFEFVDAVSHLFMPFAPPRRSDVSEADFRRFGSAVDEAYRHQDEILGTFLSEVPDSTVVIIVSDHGFRSGDARLTGGADMEEANAARWHLLEGIIVMSGPGVRKGAVLRGASIFDVAPTVMAVLGGPLAQSFEGRVLGEAFEDGFFAPADTLRLDNLPTSGYAPPAAARVTGAGSSGPADSPGTAADGTAAPSAAPAGGTAGTGDAPITPPVSPGASGSTPPGDAEFEASRHVNLGIVLARDGNAAGAEAEFRKALAIAPRSRTAANNLASITMQQGRFEESRSVLRRLLEADPDYALGWSNLALCEQRLGNNSEALSGYDRSIAIEPSDQKVLMNRGFLLLDLKRPADAEKDFRRSLAITPNLAPARFGLGAALFEQGRPEDAIRELEAALAVDPGHGRARALLERIRGGR